MKLFLFFSIALFSPVIWATNSRVIPVFFEALEHLDFPPNYVFKPEIKAALDVLQKSQIDHQFLKKFLVLKDSEKEWPLIQNRFDRWVKGDKNALVSNVEISLLATQFYVKEESDDFFNDDIYVYFFISDGLGTTAKVTSLYRGLDEGDGFYFNLNDRQLYPLSGGAKAPVNQLIVDYGIVESDGDDIKDLQKLSSIILDLTVRVYESLEPASAAVWEDVRKELQTLSELLISFNNDDRLVISSFGLTSQDLNAFLADKTYFELSKKHKKKSQNDSWEYVMTFRFLRK
jgi:hypothetical protein